MGNPPRSPNTNGAAYVFSGASGHLLHTLECPVPPYFFGTSLAWVPDVDGDGVTDVVVAAPILDRAGEVIGVNLLRARYSANAV